MIAFLLLLPFVTHSIWSYIEERRLNTRIETIVRNGEPVSTRRVTTLPPDAARAARFYRAAAVLVSDVRIGTEPRVEDYADALSLVDRAAAWPFEGFTSGTSSGALSSPLMILCRLCEARAIQRADRGDAEGAFQSLYSAARLARTHEWAVLPRLESVKAVGARVAPPPGVRAQVASAFADLDRPDNPRQRLLQTRAYLLDQFSAEQHRVPHLDDFIVRPLRIHRVVGELDVFSALIAGRQSTSNDFMAKSLREAWPFEARSKLIQCERRLVAGESTDCVR